MSQTDRQDNISQLLNRLRMRQVALILAIDEQRTLRGAANRLGLTQPAATKMLHDLESTLGLTLFDRVGRGLVLNAAGECVTRYFRSFRGGMEALNRELAEFRRGGGGRLAIGGIMAASPERLARALLALRKEWPMLAMEVVVDTSDRLLEKLREGMLEIVVGRTTGEDDDEYLFRPLDDEALSVVVANDHPLARARSIAFNELLSYDWVVQPHGSPMRTLIDQEFRDHRAPLPRDLIETGSILTSMDLVRHSDMIAVLPHTIARDNEAHGFLRILPYRFGRTLDAYGSLVRRDRPLSRPAQQFLALLHG